MSDTFTKASEYAKGLDEFADVINNVNQTFRELSKHLQDLNDGQKPEPDFLCACSGKACDGICRAKSGHFRGGESKDGGCTSAYRPQKPKAARRPRR